MAQELDGWFEYTTIGAMYVFALGLLTLRYLEIDDLRALGPTLQSCASYFVPFLLAASYLIGKATSRLLSVVGDLLPEGTRRLIRGHRVAVRDPGMPRHVRRLQHGSVELIRHGVSLHRTLELFRSLLIATPIVTACFVLWARRSPAVVLVLPAIVFAVAMTLLLFVAQRLQHRIYYEFVAAAREELGSSGPAA